MRKEPEDRIIQIISHSGYIYALTILGKMYQFDPRTGEWLLASSGLD